jgi:hypothetical protein
MKDSVPHRAFFASQYHLQLGYMTLALIFSLAGLGLGVALALAGQRRGTQMLRLALDGAILGLVPAIVLLRLLPHAWETLGIGALGLAGLGFLALHLVDIASHKAAERVGDFVVLPLLVVHAVADGTTLSAAAATVTGVPLLLALAAHRIPEGLFVAAAGERGVEMTRLVVRVGLLVAATIAGALVGDRLVGHVSAPILDSIVALGLGAMLHVTVHGASSPDHAAEHAHGDHDHAHDDHDHAHPPAETVPLNARALSALAFAAGLAAALLLPGETILDAAQPDEVPVRVLVPTLFVESAPALLIALAFAALARYRRWRPSVGATMLTALAPLGSWVAAAIFAVRILGVTWTAAALIGVAAASFLGAALAHHTTPIKVARGDRLVAVGVVGLRHLVGLALVGAVEAALAPNALANFSAPAQLAIAVGAALVGPADALAAVLFAAVLVHKGISPAAAAAGLVASTAQLARLDALRIALGRGGALRYALGALLVAVAAGAAIHRLTLQPPLPLHELIGHQHTGGERIAAALAGLLVGLGLARLGPRRGLAAAAGGAPRV